MSAAAALVWSGPMLDPNFGPLGSAFAGGNPVLGNRQVAGIAARLGRTPAQIALAWLLSFGRTSC